MLDTLSVRPKLYCAVLWHIVAIRPVLAVVVVVEDGTLIYTDGRFESFHNACGSSNVLQV